MNTFAEQLGAFSSDRLSFDIVSQKDATELQALTDDPVITEMVSFLSDPFSLSACQSLIDHYSTHTDRVFVGRTKSDHTMVSLIGAHLAENKKIEIGYWVGANFQGQGYGFEAAAALLKHIGVVLPGYDIFAECAPDNLSSRYLLEKLGFETTNRDGERAGRKRFVYRNKL